MNKITEKLMEVQDRVRTDPEYLARYEEYRDCNAALIRVLEELPPEQRGVVEDYIGICVELHTRMLRIACQL